MDLQELRRQHADIIAAAQALLDAVPDENHPTSVASVRWHLARLLIAHLAVEDRHFYPALLRHDQPSVRETAARFQTEMGSLSQAFTTYMSAWTDASIASEWPRFCKDTRAIVAALSRRVAQEDHQLYPLADDTRRRSV